jgi:tRNA pseudouridine55 synthase
MYTLARLGLPVTVTPRKIHVYDIHLIAYASRSAHFRVECGGGTYMRSIVHDLGTRLGCYAHMTSLERLKHGPFCLDDCLDLADCFPDRVSRAIALCHHRFSPLLPLVVDTTR